jgi:hypothetical protein
MEGMPKVSQKIAKPQPQLPAPKIPQIVGKRGLGGGTTHTEPG